MLSRSLVITALADISGHMRSHTVRQKLELHTVQLQIIQFFIIQHTICPPTQVGHSSCSQIWSPASGMPHTTKVRDFTSHTTRPLCYSIGICPAVCAPCVMSCSEMVCQMVAMVVATACELAGRIVTTTGIGYACR